MGLGEGVAPSGATDMVARVIAKNERARAISFIFSGLHVGSLLGLLVAPPLIENFGWEVVFLHLRDRWWVGSEGPMLLPVTIALCCAVGAYEYRVHPGKVSLRCVKVSGVCPQACVGAVVPICHAGH